MKLSNLFFTFIIVICPFLFFSCSDDNMDNILGNGTGEGSNQNKSVDLTTIDYQLGDFCQWDNMENEEIYVIRSFDEMKNYVTCENGDAAEIDFDNYSLVLAKGITTSGIAQFKKELSKTEDDKYILSVDILLNAATVIGQWNIAILVPELPADAEIALEVKADHGIITPDQELAIIDYELAAACEWRGLENGKIYLINSMVELRQYITCGDIEEIDFDKYSLVLTSGQTTSGIHSLTKRFWFGAPAEGSPHSGTGDFYTLEVDIELNEAAVAEMWTVAVLTPRLPDNSKIYLKVEMDGGIIEPDIKIVDYLLLNHCINIIGEENIDCEKINIEHEKVYIIRNERELDLYLGGEQKFLPEIDFSKYNLVLTKGTAPHGIAKINRSFLHLNDNNYLFNVNIYMDITTVAPEWVVGILVSVLPESANVEMNITKDIYREY